MNERKQSQLAHEIRSGVQQVLGRGLSDPRIRGLVTITEVEVSPDRRNATVYVSVFPEDRVELAMHGLHDAEKHVRHEVGEIIRTRMMPVLTFKRDDRIKKEAAVLRAINEAAERDAAAQAAEAGAGNPSPSAQQEPRP